MEDFLTRLIERSRGIAPQGALIQPLIAPLYAAGPYSADMSGEKYEEMTSVTERKSHFASQSQGFASPGAETMLVHRPKEDFPITLSSQRREQKDKDTAQIKPERAPANEAQGTRPNQTPGVESLPQATTPKSPSAPMTERPGTDAFQYGRAKRESIMIRPQTVSHAESDSRAAAAVDDASGETTEPLIRVTIGRVDVRAITQSVPPARRTPAAVPKLSLEDYLRSRSGRK